MSRPEPWLRGPVEGIASELQPVVHALLFAREELERVLPALSAAQVWARPNGIASIGYHVRHCTGSLERMLTYVRGESLSEQQMAALKAEREDRPELDGAALLEHAQRVIDQAISAARTTHAQQLEEPREVGRQKLPSSVRGLFGEMAVHTARHVGQVATTAKLVPDSRT
jgi:hypothetical protein